MSETLEPRVMQVLVALADSRGEVVSRDELIARCWGGTIVGDNAIQRAIYVLRDLAAGGLGQASFAIETITKVGYRLVERKGAVAIQVRRNWSTSAARIWLPSLLFVAAIAGAAYTWSRASAVRPLAFAVTAEAGAGADESADALAADLVDLLSIRAPTVEIAGPGGRAQSRHQIRIRTATGGGNERAGVTIVSVDRRQLLWSAGFERPQAQAGLLRRTMASRLGALLLCVSKPGEAARLDPEGLRLLFSICDRFDRIADEATVELLRAFVRRAPNSAWGWAELALVEAQVSSFGGRPGSPQFVALRDSARRNLQRARSLQPTLGILYLTESLLLPDHDWGNRLRLLDAGLAADGSEARLRVARADLLAALGFNNAAIDNAHHAVTLDPLSPEARSLLVSLLAYSGQAEAAARELETAEGIWPGAAAMLEVRRRLDLRFGDPRAALASIAGAAGFSEQQAAFLRARADPTPAKVEAAIEIARRTTIQNPGVPIWYVQTLGTFGRTDEFFALFDDPRAAGWVRDATSVLLRGHMRSLWLDPRFMEVMARVGLVRFWMDRGNWPDFCRDPDLPYDCPAEGRRALAELEGVARPAR
jgi:tetratricopeptide (TPR) repeat protein